MRRIPTAAELDAARNGATPDLIAPDLRVLFCGINPSLMSVVVGHHFARPGNRFWPALHAAGFTPRRYAAHEEHLLLEAGCGITNIVPRATASAAEITADELRAGAIALEAKIRRYRPRWLAVLGISAYRAAFARPKAALGPQEETIGEACIWVLPNPSGLNAHFTPAALAHLFAELRREAFPESADADYSSGAAARPAGSDSRQSASS
jgi:double-stranded uracil-DNA glycosylase